jgi:hypothetical protein
MAKQIQLRYSGNGILHVASRLDRELIDEAADVGEVIVVTPSKRRSGIQNRYYWAIITAAHDNQTAGPLFDTREQLRAWILCEIGHCDVTTISLAGVNPTAVAGFVAPIAAAMRKATSDVVISYDNENHALQIRTARSTSYRKCGSQLFGDVVDRTCAIIEQRICPGLSVTALQEHAKAA